MDLKTILPGKDGKKSKEYFWALSIEPSWVQAACWLVEDDTAKIVAFSNPSAWELDGELIEAVDAVLSSVAQNLPEDAKEPSKTVFGVVSSWVKDGGIVDEKLETIKKICTELSLKPAGFVVMSEAIAHLIKSEEGTPLNAVVLGLSEQNIEMTIFNLGEVVGTSNISRSVSVVDDVSEGLTRFAGVDLPSRFVLYNGKEGELEEVRQLIVRADWNNSSDIKLLHTPKIEVVKPERKIQAVSLAGAAEIGGVSRLFGGKADMEDISKVSHSEMAPREEPNVIEPEKKVSAQELGFVVGGAMASETTEKMPTPDPVHNVPVAEKAAVAATGTAVATQGEKPKRRFKFPSITLPKLRRSKKDGMSGGLGNGKKIAIVGVVAFLVIAIIGFAAWWYLPSAAVTVYLTTDKLEEQISIVIDPSASSTNFEEGVLPGSVIETSVSGTKTKSTTGVKTVGDKAAGEVTIYRSGSELTLESGTEVIGPGDLKFTLDESVQIASGSAGTPGTAKVNVAALDIGAEHNLASGTIFSVGNYLTSDLEAKNETDFSGGTSRDINAVSEDDIEMLEDELTEELEQKASEELSGMATSDQFFIEESLDSKPAKSEFSAKVGDEAETLKLDLTLDAQALVVEKSALEQMAAEALKDSIPDGFVLRGDQIDMSFELDEEEDGVYTVTAKVTANLLPEADPVEIAKNIAGKYPTAARDSLNNETPGFVRVEIILSPKLPGRLGRLPQQPSRIEVSIAASR